MPVQQLLQHVKYASYQSVWQPWSTPEHNQPKHANYCTLLDSPLHIFQVTNIISIVVTPCTSLRRFICFFLCTGAPETGGSDLVDYSNSTLNEDTRPWKLWLGSLSIYRTPMWWNTLIILWLALFYTTLRWSYRHATRSSNSSSFGPSRFYRSAWQWP
jgi:hypothetical protein